MLYHKHIVIQFSEEIDDLIVSLILGTLDWVIMRIASKLTIIFSRDQFVTQMMLPVSRLTNAVVDSFHEIYHLSRNVNEVPR